MRKLTSEEAKEHIKMMKKNKGTLSEEKFGKAKHLIRGSLKTKKQIYEIALETSANLDGVGIISEALWRLYKDKKLCKSLGLLNNIFELRIISESIKEVYNGWKNNSGYRNRRNIKWSISFR